MDVPKSELQIMFDWEQRPLESGMYAYAKSGELLSEFARQKVVRKGL